jgi:uncharacterized protein VirK/YbjX
MFTARRGGARAPAVSVGQALWRLPSQLFAYVRRELSERGLAGLFRTVVLFAGVLRHWPQHRALISVLKGAATRPVWDAYPRLEYRYTLPYLSLRFERQARYDMLKAHYAVINAYFKPSFSRDVLSESLCLWHGHAHEVDLAIFLKGHCLKTRHREGELTLVFKMDHISLYELSFTFIRMASMAGVNVPDLAPSDYVAYVGRVQGAPGQYERIRQATKACGEVAPPDMLMAALAGLAAVLDVRALLGGSEEDNISRETILRSETTFAYADFWARYSAKASDQGHAVMLLPFEEKPIVAIASRHRGRTLRKRELKQAVATQSAQAIPVYLIKGA